MGVANGLLLEASLCLERDPEYQRETHCQAAHCQSGGVEVDQVVHSLCQRPARLIVWAITYNALHGHYPEVIVFWIEIVAPHILKF